MHQRFSIKVIVLCLCVIMFGAGCKSQEPVQTHTSEVQTITPDIKLSSLDSEVVYEIPICKVKVLVDRNGYQTNRSKKVLFLGENLSEEFRVVNEDTDEVIYTGKISMLATDSQNDTSVYIGDFSDVISTGNYYIETAKIGRSYTFPIAEDVEMKMLQNVILSSHSISYGETATDVKELALCIHANLQALQFHGSIFDKDSELVTWLLKAASLIMSAQNEQGSIQEDYEATAAFCGAMLMCANNFDKYDQVLAASYRKAAQNAWKWLTKNTAELQEEKEALFYAASAQQYCNIILDRTSKDIVLSYIKSNKGQLTNSFYAIFGSIMYLSTKSGTDRDLCHIVMQEIVNQTENICERQKQNPYLICDLVPEENMKKLILISFVDYVSPSNEYAVVMDNSFHYYGGRNYQGEILFSSEGIWENEAYQDSYAPVWNGIVINCLSSLIDDNE